MPSAPLPAGLPNSLTIRSLRKMPGAHFLQRLQQSTLPGYTAVTGSGLEELESFSFREMSQPTKTSSGLSWEVNRMKCSTEIWSNLRYFLVHTFLLVPSLTGAVQLWLQFHLTLEQFLTNGVLPISYDTPNACFPNIVPLRQHKNFGGLRLFYHRLKNHKIP